MEELSTIQEIIDMPLWSDFATECMVVSKQKLQKKDESDYIILKVQDRTGKIEMPVWENVDTCDENINIGSILKITGKRTQYDNKPQIRRDFVEFCEDKNKDDFIPSYKISNELIDSFGEYLKKIKDERYFKLLKYFIGVDIVKDNYDSPLWQDFLRCPSAEKHHGNKLSGLFLHSYGVLRAIDNMLNDYKHSPFFLSLPDNKIDEDMLRFLAATHDTCKKEEYEYEYEIKRKINISVGHDVMFIGRLSSVNEKCGKIFTVEELAKMSLIILLHHGKWSKYKLNEKDSTPIEATLLHLADMIDSQIVGVIES